MSVLKDNNTGRLFIQFQFRGAPYKQRLPKGMTKKQGSELELKWKTDLLFADRGLTTARTEITYERFIDQYFGPFVETHYSEMCQEQAANVVRASLPFLKGKPLRSIKPADIDRFQASRMVLQTRHGRPRKPATVIRELSIISRIFSLAVKNDLCDYNPVSRIEKPKFDNIQDKILKGEDEEKFLLAFRNSLQRDICKLVLNTGLRQNDVLGLSKFNVDLNRNVIRLVQGKTKRLVEIPLNQTAQEVITSRWHNGHDLIFPSYRSGGKNLSIKNAIRFACVRAGIEPLTLRDLRRTFGTRLHELGFDDSTVAQLLGHSDLRSIHRYKRGSEIKKEAVFSLESAKNLPDVKRAAR